MSGIGGRIDELRPVSPAAAGQYAFAQGALCQRVNEALLSRADIERLIGRGQSDLMRMNHENHAQFMTVIFHFNLYGLLERTIPWVYHAYRRHGFSYEYFPVEIKAWKQALQDVLEPLAAQEIAAVYEWMERHHDHFVCAVERGTASFADEAEALSARQEQFLEMLMSGDHRACLRLVQGNAQTALDIEHFYLEVLQPCLYRIGHYWQNGEISVAQEHLMSSIVNRIMSQLYPRFILTEPSRGRAVVTAAPNDFHEIGARMTADFLERDGWDVCYLGANTPQGDLLAELRRQPPVLLGIAVTITYHLLRVAEIIRAVRTDGRLSGMRIMVGGPAFHLDPDIWRRIGADCCAGDARQAVLLARSWGEKEGEGIGEQSMVPPQPYSDTVFGGK